MNIRAGPAFRPSLEGIVRFKRAGALRLLGQTHFGQLVSEKPAAEDARRADKPDNSEQLRTTPNNAEQRRTSGVLSGVPERPGLWAFFGGRF
jgi:hypothetical protein